MLAYVSINIIETADGLDIVTNPDVTSAHILFDTQK